MPERPAPEEEGRAEVAEEAVFHDAPVRIPISALPATLRPSGGSRFSTLLVIGTAAAPWFAGALITGDPTAVWFAAAWLTVLVFDFALALRRP